MAAIASLPWYYFGPLDRQYQTFWQHFRDILLAEGNFKPEEVPEELGAAIDFRAHWANPELLLCQCCGYHIATHARDLKVVGAPAFALDCVRPGMYRSVIVKNKKVAGSKLADFRGKRVAYNEDQSYSGYIALLREVLKLRSHKDFFPKRLQCESHLASMRQISDGGADIAAIDEVSYRIIVEQYPEFENALEIIATTEEAMAPPYVTSAARPPEQIDSIGNALIELSLRQDEELQDALRAMKICKIVDSTNEDYQPMARDIEKVEASDENVWADEQSP